MITPPAQEVYSISVGENFTPPTLTAYDNDGVLPVTVAGIVDTDTILHTLLKTNMLHQP
jgi:hypothetical protein